MSDPRPYYRAHLFVCTNSRPSTHPRSSCAGKDSIRLRDYMKARVKELGLDLVRINSAGCLDRCELGPVMVIYPEGIWYSYATYSDIDEIIQTHLINGNRVTRLLLHPEDGPQAPEETLKAAR